MAGLSVLSAKSPPPPPDAYKLSATICEGEVYRFDTMNLVHPGVYTKTYTRQSGCDSVVALHLDVKNKSRTSIDQTICEGESFEGYTSSGTYIDTYIAANGCDSIRTLNLMVQQKPRPDLGERKVICEGDSVLISPGLFSSYQWQDGSSDQYFSVKSPGQYSVTVSNSCGTASDQIIITNGNCAVYFPSAFTPNNDGRNDYLSVLTDYLLQEYHLTIFNRWGKKYLKQPPFQKGGTVILMERNRHPALLSGIVI